MLAQRLTQYSPWQIWICLFSLQMTAVLSLFWLTGSHFVFYGLGFLILWNAAIGIFPLWMIHFFLPQKKTTNALTLRLQNILSDEFKNEQTCTPQLHPLTTGWNNILVLQWRHQVIIAADIQWLERLSHEETRLVFKAVHSLYLQKVLQSALLLSAIYKLIPFSQFFLRLKKAAIVELGALAAGESPAWNRLNLKMLHQNRKITSQLPLFTRPIQMFPLLTVEQKDSYFSIYKATRDRLLESLKEQRT